MRLADGFAQTFRDRLTSVKPHESLPEGAEVTVSESPTDLDEYAEVARACDRLIVSGARPEDIAVLVRSNTLAQELALAFATEGIPHTTTEQLRFFRRNEVKDVLALMRLSVNRTSETAARRTLFTFWPEQKRMVKEAIQKGATVGARVSDLLDSDVIRAGDPLAGLSDGSVVILDTETTGLNPSRDEVIEVAAVRMENGNEVGRFHRYTCPSRPVGISQGIHGLSDEFLAREGSDPAQVFHELREFIGSTPIAGHNVEFDRKILLSHARRVGVTLMLHVAFDTMDVARRFYRSTSYRLEDLAPELGIPVPESHRAMGDVVTTAALADVLRERGRTDDRRQTGSSWKRSDRHSPKFGRCSTDLSHSDARPTFSTAFWRSLPSQPASRVTTKQSGASSDCAGTCGQPMTATLPFARQCSISSRTPRS